MSAERPQPRQQDDAIWQRNEPRPSVRPSSVPFTAETEELIFEERQTETGAVGGRTFFIAEQRPDGTYAVTLTEPGLRAFETSLGIADDLGGQSRISPQSTLADLMERTATREKLSLLLRRGGEGWRYHLHLWLLRRRLRGSEAPSAGQRMISHIGRVVIVVAFALWTVMQFMTAVSDITAIPGILATIPGDLLHLHAPDAFHEVGLKISDAGYHVLLSVLGVALTVIVTGLIHPFGTIYRKDQLVPGERLLLSALARWVGQ